MRYLIIPFNQYYLITWNITDILEFRLLLWIAIDRHLIIHILAYLTEKEKVSKILKIT